MRPKHQQRQTGSKPACYRLGATPSLGKLAHHGSRDCLAACIWIKLRTALILTGIPGQIHATGRFEAHRLLQTKGSCAYLSLLPGEAAEIKAVLTTCFPFDVCYPILHICKASFSIS